MTFDPSTVTVPAHDSRTVNVTLAMSAAAVKGLPSEASISSNNFGALTTVRGAVLATPTTPGTGVYGLRVPFLAVPRGLSNVAAGTPTKPVSVSPDTPVFSTHIPLSNTGVHSGDADVDAWGISDPNDVVDTAEDATDVRAVGVQSFPGDDWAAFAVDMYGRWTNASSEEVDLAIDNNKDGTPDYYLVGVDYGILATGQFDGRFATFVTDGDFNVIDVWVNPAPMNGSVAELGAPLDEIGLTSGHGLFRYAVATGSIVPGGLNDSTTWATFDAFAPSVDNGAFATLAPGVSGALPVQFDQAKVASQKTLGWMVVTLDDANGAAQADTVAVPNASVSKRR